MLMTSRKSKGKKSNVGSLLFIRRFYIIRIMATHVEFAKDHYLFATWKHIRFLAEREELRMLLRLVLIRRLLTGA